MSQISYSYKTKFAGETIDYVADFSTLPEIIGNDTLVSADVPTVSGISTGNFAITTVDVDGVPAAKGVQCRVWGGTVGQTYTILFVGTLASGAIRIRGLKLTIE